MKKSFLTFLFLIMVPVFANADLVILKNGDKIETKRAWEEDGQIKFYRYGGIVGYPKELVDRIETEEAQQTVSITKSEAPRSIPPNYIGNDIVEVFKSLGNIKDKQEYETTEQYKSRVEKIANCEAANSVYAFKYSEPPIEYDADKGIFKIEVNGMIAHFEGHTYKYLAQNAFGATTEVTENFGGITYRLNIVNNSELERKLTEYRYKKYLDVKVPLTLAEEYRKRIKLLYVCLPSLYVNDKGLYHSPFQFSPDMFGTTEPFTIKKGSIRVSQTPTMCFT